MGCLVVPVSVLMRRCSGKHRLGYRPLADNGVFEDKGPVTVIVGRERREFLVDPFVLEESPFRVLIETSTKGNNKERRNRGRDDHGFSNNNNKRVIFVDVDEILFEHMLWLMYNDCSSLFKLNVREIIDFYALDC